MPARSSALTDALRGAFVRASARARRHRAEVFRQALHPTAADRILDLGSEDGGHLAAVVPFRENVWIADIDPVLLERGRATFGFRTIELDESGRVPVADQEFDIVFCSSVLEHVTVDKDALDDVRSRRDFERRAFERQRRFATEIARIGRRYFVQTPYRYFPIESHTWLPAPIAFLPRPLLLRLLPWIGSWWIKSTQADFNLLTRAQMQELFPDAEIRVERFLGLPKSLIALRAQPGASSPNRS
jgi:hypothetical protein